ncbi:MAG: hypothetical protein NC314_04845 [Roseburia sp.]|nr:hypothetical protein [Roseburia sp.]MCM1242147.1 hypothetical protein [Roseburia sp.]
MSRLHKVLIATFCCGVLLCGMGAGVMFTELDGLQYGGTQIIGSSDMQTKNIDVEFASEEEMQKVESGYFGGMGTLQTDSSIPKNTIRFQVTYDAERIEPYVFTADETDERIVFSWYWTGHDEDLEFFMEAKDVFLQNLREGKLVSIETEDVMQELTILVNPADEERVQLMY